MNLLQAVCAARADADAGIGLCFDPNTYGAITDLQQPLSCDPVCATLDDAVIEAMFH